MAEIGLDAGQVATASGYIYINHAKYGICEIKEVTLESYLAIIKIQPINASSIPVHGLRRLDFSEFQRMGFGLEFRIGIQRETNNRSESPNLTWLLDDSDDDQEVYSDEDEAPAPRKSQLPETSPSRKRLRHPDFSSPVLEKRSRQSRSIGSSNKRVPKYECTECDAAFSNSKHLRRHGRELNHIGTERPFKCDTCGTEFRWKEDRDLHVRIHHKPEPKESPWADRIHDPTISLPLFQIHPIRTFEEAANIIAFQADDMSKEKDSKVCNTVPQFCLGPMATYLVDLTKLNHHEDIGHDSYGSWGHQTGESALYSMDFTEKTVKRLNQRHKSKSKKKKKVDVVKVDDSKVDLKVRRRFHRHPQENQFRKSVFIGYFGENLVPKWAIISYEWLCTPYEIVSKPHGNAKFKIKPYQPTAASVRLLFKERATQLTAKQNTEVVSQQIQKAIGPAFVPRDRDQARHARWMAAKKRKSAGKDQ